jgi:hypothetical protein
MSVGIEYAHQQGEGHMARYLVTYEWAWEYTDSFGDIQEIEHSETLADLGSPRTVDACTPAMVLVRHEGNPDEGIMESTYAYVTTCALPSHFGDDEHKVPKRFSAELTRVCARQ